MEADLINNPDPRVKTNIVWYSYVPYDTTTSRNYILTIAVQLYVSIFAAYGYGTSDNLYFIYRDN